MGTFLPLEGTACVAKTFCTFKWQKCAFKTPNSVKKDKIVYPNVFLFTI